MYKIVGLEKKIYFSLHRIIMNTFKALNDKVEASLQSGAEILTDQSIKDAFVCLVEDLYRFSYKIYDESPYEEDIDDLDSGNASEIVKKYLKLQLDISELPYDDSKKRFKIQSTEVEDWAEFIWEKDSFTVKKLEHEGAIFVLEEPIDSKKRIIEDWVSLEGAIQEFKDNITYALAHL